MPNNIRISLKIDTLENWNNSDLILQNGEVAFIQMPNGTTKIKIGDGINVVKQLPFINEIEFFTKELSTQQLNIGLQNKTTTYSSVIGQHLSANSSNSTVFGFNAETLNTDQFSFVWNGKNLYGYNNRYKSHGAGTFSLNPENGISGIYIGEDTLASMLNTIYINGEKTNEIQVINISQDDYHSLVKAGNALSNAIYIVSSDIMNMYNERITNLADGISANDAVNLNQLCSAISSIDIPEIPTKVSVFENDANYTKLSVDQIPTTGFNVKHVSQDEYHTEVINGTDPNTLYIVSSDSLNMYGEAIQNLADPISATDAVNKQYVDSISTYLSNDYEQKINSNSESSNNKLNIISNIVDNKITIDGLSTENFEVKHISQNDYHTLVKDNNVLSNVIYVVSSDTLNMYNERIINVADAISGNDAVNLNQLSNVQQSLKASIDNKVYIDGESSESLSVDTLNIIKLSRDDYYQLSIQNKLCSDYIYVTSFDELNMYNQKITNVGTPVYSSDAVNLSTLNKIVNDVSTITHNKINDKLYVDGVSAESLSVENITFVNLTRDEYIELKNTGNLCSNYMYITEFDQLNMHNQKIVGLKDGVVNNDAVTVGQMISAINDNTEIIENKLAEKIIINEQSVDQLSIINISQNDYHNLVVSENGPISNALYIVSSDTLNMYGERIENVADGISANDAATYGQLSVIENKVEDLASNVRKDSHVVTLENDKYRCYPYKTNIINDSLTGIVPLILDDFQINKQYDIWFSTGESKTILEFYYENENNGIEIDDSWNINKNYKFEPNKSYLIKVRQDLIEVVEDKYDGSSSSSSSENHSYKLVTAELLGTTSLSCNIEDRTITTVVVSDSEIPITVNFPQKIDGYARDFILRIEVTSSEAPEFTFTGLDDSWSVDAEDDEWMFMQPGTNIISFTEMK